MLQPRNKDSLALLLACAIAAVWITACRPDTSTNTAEESAYLADYEAPANKWGFIDTTGRLVIRPAYDDVGSFSEGYAAVNQNGKWGYIDHKGDIVIKPAFRSAWAFHEGKARVKPFDMPEQYVSVSGKTLSSAEWTASADFSGGMAKVSIGSAVGYIDSTGQLVIPAIYDRGWNFKDGLAVIGFEGKLGVINAQGKEVIPPDFEQVKFAESGNLILCNTADSSFAYSLSGDILARLSGLKMVESNGQVISISAEDQMFFFRLDLKQLVAEPLWSNIIYLDTNRWAGKNSSGYLLLDGRGKILDRKSYTQINRFSGGFAAFFNGESWGYIDSDGTSLTADVFGLAWDYKEGFARAAFAEGIAFLNREHKLAFYPPGGTIDMRDFSEHLAPVQMAAQ